MLDKQNSKLITDYNYNASKVHKLNKETLSEIRSQLVKYKDQTFGKKFHIPFRVPKIIILSTITLAIYGIHTWYYIKKYQQFQNQQITLEQRTVTPFLQMVEDLEFIRIQQREQMINDVLYSKEDKKKVIPRFFHNEEFVTTNPRTYIFNLGEPLNYISFSDQVKLHLIPGTDKFNI